MTTGLRSVIEQAAAEEEGTLQDFTVLALQNDPFRIDTPARHRDGKWLADAVGELGLGTRRIHLRGLHYALLEHPKPNGEPYRNTPDDWEWLQGDAGKAARWLGYIGFDRIVDQRNAPPVVRIHEPKEPRHVLRIGVDVQIPHADELTPEPDLVDFEGTQPYKLVIFGEKASLEDVLGPIAARCEADLYLATGEISDTLLYQMARIGDEDGRPMVVFCFADADPAGWQMPVSIGRKLQAFRDGFFPDLEFEVRPVALTPDHVRANGLPSTPLKATEKRADAWREALGVEQTEIDALASLRPDVLRQLAREALDPFFDSTLETRVFEARVAWLNEAQAAIDEHLESEQLEQIREEATERLDELRAEIRELTDSLELSADEIDLPEPPDVPEAELDGIYRLPLISSAWSFAEQSRRLIDHRAYRNGAGS